jgi:hypothetical protein
MGRGGDTDPTPSVGVQQMPIPRHDDSVSGGGASRELVVVRILCDHLSVVRVSDEESVCQERGEERLIVRAWVRGA